MKLRKKSLIFGAIALCVAAGVLFIGLFIGCGPHRPCKRDFSKHVLKRMDRQVRKLDLSDTQQAKYEEIRKKIEADLAEGANQHRQLFEQLQSEFNKENPDMNIVTEMVKDRFRGMPDFMGKHLDYFLEFYNVLDDNQKTQVIKKIRKKMEKLSKWHDEDEIGGRS